MSPGGGGGWRGTRGLLDPTPGQRRKILPEDGRLNKVFSFSSVCAAGAELGEEGLEASSAL